MIEYIGSVKLDLTYYKGADGYSDGSVEDELLQIVKEYKEDHFAQVIYQREDWPILYHLSSDRQNVISWLPMNSSEKVLEIGAGCGAITSCLCKICKEVQAIELSKKRSLINAYRNKDKQNLLISVGNFKDIFKILKKEYSLITLIGVLEYSDLYIGGSDSHIRFLAMLDKILLPGGRIVIAIENRLGLKYFAGCREDHLGVAFAGIDNYKLFTNSVRTFSRNELIALIIDAGYSTFDFYYPYPDYKLPYKIYSDHYLPQKGELIDNIRNFDSDRYVLFDESGVYDDIIDMKCYPDFANSFIVVIQKKR